MMLVTEALTIQLEIENASLADLLDLTAQTGASMKFDSLAEDVLVVSFTGTVVGLALIATRFETMDHTMDLGDFLTETTSEDMHQIIDRY